jgi:secreted PhoX family phosphatase
MSKLEQLVSDKISRREMLARSGKASAFLTLGAIFPSEFFARVEKKVSPAISADIFFNPIPPSDEDNLILPEGFEFKIIRKWGDKISATDDFGFNNDYVVYLPIDLHSGGSNSEDGLLFVNHEFPSPLFINNYSDDDFRAGRIKSAEEVSREKKSVGFSILRVKRTNGEWEFVDDDKYNRRVDADSPVKISGRAEHSELMGNNDFAKGTLANCSGGVTPWGTVLSGEENFQDYFASENIWEYRWNDVEKDFNVNHYGWVVEVDPFDKNSVPVKRTSLGRFRHENVAISISPKGKVVAYMGDDKVNECVYKFVSHKIYDMNDRAKNSDILDVGDLYVADFENGKWQLLDFQVREELKKEFSSQAEVLIQL